MNEIGLKSVSTMFAVVMFLMSSPGIASSACAGLSGCERKFCEIEVQIEDARANGNPHTAEGLSKALAEARSGCSDASLRRDLLEDIDEAKNDIAEYEKELREAMEAGKESKLSKYREKIAQERIKLERLQGELSALE